MKGRDDGGRFAGRRAMAVAAGVLAAAVVVVLILARAPRPRPVPPEPVPAPVFERIEAGRSVEGRPIELIRVGSSADTDLLVLASIHGSEPAGTPLVEKLADWLRSSPEHLAGGRILLVPVANPDGMAAGRRLNANGVDLNRNFPAGNRIDRARFGEAPLSEPESRVLHAILEEHDPRAVVSIHQPLECVDYDGPAAGLAEAVSQGCGLPVRRLGARPGSLGAYVGETLGKPIVTLELPRHVPADAWEVFGPGLRAAVEHVIATRGEGTGSGIGSEEVGGR